MFFKNKRYRRILNKNIEENRILRLGVKKALKENNINSLLITSANSCEGKTSVVYELASSITKYEKDKIIIVDCNFKNPSISRIYKVDNEICQYCLLDKEHKLSECINNISAYVDIVTIKNDTVDERELLDNINNVIVELLTLYNLVLIDTSSIFSSIDAEIISSLADGTLMVVDVNKSKQYEVIKAKERLKACGANIIGVIVNNYKKGSFMDEKLIVV